MATPNELMADAKCFYNCLDKKQMLAVQTYLLASMSDVVVGAAIGFSHIIDGGGSVISTGIAGDIQVPMDMEPEIVTLLADQSGSVVLDLWKSTYAAFPPTVADTITAAAKPTIVAADSSQDTTLVGWTINWTAGDIIRVNVDSAATITRLTLAIIGRKT